MEQLSYKWLESYKYELAEDFIIKLSFGPPSDITQEQCEKVQFFTSGLLIICRGFKWDGASGPTIDDPTNMRGALVHDALYYLMRKKLLPRKQYRDEGDKELYKIIRADGMPWLRARAWLNAVRLFADEQARYRKGGDRQDKVINIEYEEY